MKEPKKILKGIIAFMLISSIAATGIACINSEPSEKQGTDDNNTTEATTTTVDNVNNTTKPEDDINNPDDKSKQKRVLFIGNSLTYYNDMPKIFEELAKAGEKNIYVEAITKGSSSLFEHASDKTEIGKSVSKALTNENNWDYVIIQVARRINPMDETVKEAVFNAAKVMAQRIRDIGAEPIIYSVLGNNFGKVYKYEMNADGISSKKYSDIYRTMNHTEHAAYLKSVALEMSREINAPIVNTGDVVEYLISGIPSINFYDADDQHPSKYGSYAIACCFYTQIYGTASAEAATKLNNNSIIDSKLAIAMAQAADHILLEKAEPDLSQFAPHVADDPTVSKQYGGSGSQSDPFIISNKSEFLYLVERSNAGESFAGKYFLQTADIDLLEGVGQSIDSINEATIASIGTVTPFEGNYNGGNRLIKNFRNAGLFANVNNAVIKNLFVSDAFIEGSCVGAFIGTATGNTQIDSCSTLNNVKVNGSDFAGGIIGNSVGAAITNCSNKGDISVTDGGSNTYVGGIAGCASGYNKKITNCGNYGNITCYNDTANKNACVGGILGCSGNVATDGLGNVSLEYCFNEGKISFTYDGKNKSRAYTGGILGRAGNSEKNNMTISHCYNKGSLENVSKNSSYYPGIGQLVGVYVNPLVTVENCFGLDTVSTALTAAYGNDAQDSNYVIGKFGGKYSPATYIKLSSTVNVKPISEIDTLILTISSNFQKLS